MRRCYDYDVALREAWAMMTPEMRKAVLKRMRDFDEYRALCADFLEAAYDVEAEVGMKEKGR